MGRLFKENSDRNFGLNLDQDDFDILKNRVYSEFGYPILKVELTDSQFLMIIHAGVEYLNMYSPKGTEVRTLVSPLYSEYHFDDLDRDITAVLGVYFPLDWHIMQGAPVDILFPEISMIRASNDAAVMSDFVVKQAQNSMAKTIFGTKPTPELIGPRTIRVLPRPIMESAVCFKITTNHDEHLGSLDDYERNWLIRFCCSRTERVLGRVRSKYSNVALPIGDISADGKDLISSGTESEKELITEIKARNKFPESYLFVG